MEVALRSATKGDRVHMGCAAMLEETIGVQPYKVTEKGMFNLLVQIGLQSHYNLNLKYYIASLNKVGQLEKRLVNLLLKLERLL